MKSEELLDAEASRFMQSLDDTTIYANTPFEHARMFVRFTQSHLGSLAKLSDADGVMTLSDAMMHGRLRLTGDKSAFNDAGPIKGVHMMSRQFEYQRPAGVYSVVGSYAEGWKPAAKQVGLGQYKRAWFNDA